MRHTRSVLAIEAMAAARALDLLRPLRSSAPLEQAHERIRGVSPAFDGDRTLHQDIAAIEALIGEGKLRL